MGTRGSMAAGIVLIIIGAIFAFALKAESVDGVAQTEQTTVVERKVD